MTDISHIILTQICLTAGAYGASARLLPVYFGTYTQNSPSQGIYRSVLDLESGKLSEPSLVAETPNPSFLVIHPNQRFLYCVSEAGPSGVVRAFAVERQTGALSLLNERPSGGAGPCHVSMDQTGRVLLVANYGSGSAAVLPVGADGRLGEPICSVQHKGSSIDPRRQRGPHAHSINVSPDNRFAFVADLGLDKIMVYRLGIDHAKITTH
ncbi:MAG: beta-propeller fold lactonase family protein, partial [Planctomycetes bacterium]|nr:beta-propeller fold lactonase family protein [Planctomycetota bacterium]